MRKFLYLAIVALSAALFMACPNPSTDSAQAAAKFTVSYQAVSVVCTPSDADVFIDSADTSKVIFTFTTSATAVQDVSCFDPPDGAAFKILGFGKVPVGTGKLAFGVPASLLKAGMKVTSRIKFVDPSAYVYFTIVADPPALPKKAIPGDLSVPVMY